MATTIVSPSTAADDNIPTATLALPSIPSSSRRLPPPCWSPEETAALIDAYRDKWYSLRRGNLRANHWQEVADDIASHSPASPPKTAVQCRHKMEKLRKRYRAEIQRATAHGGVSRHVSSWAHFHKMHSMEKGPNPSPPSSSSSEEIEINHKNNNNIKRINDLNYNQSVFPNGVRIKIPGRVNSIPLPAPNTNNPNPRFANFGSNGKKRVGEIPKIVNDKESGVGELVAAIHSLGEGFMRMEKVKMDMVRQVEEMRMEMELKRTEMILESEQRTIEAFVKGITERSSKRAKRNSVES